MNIIFTDQSWEQYEQLIDTDEDLLNRINTVIEELTSNSNTNNIIKESEASLKTNCRKLDDSNNLIFQIDGDNLIIINCYGQVNS